MKTLCLFLDQGLGDRGGCCLGRRVTLSNSGRREHYQD
jgi:hypothetical protein